MVEHSFFDSFNNIVDIITVAYNLTAIKYIVKFTIIRIINIKFEDFLSLRTVSFHSPYENFLLQ